MRGIGSVTSKFASHRLVILAAAAALFCAGCNSSSTAETRTIQIQQNWELQPGKTVGGHRIAGGLGDITIDMGGDRVFAPFDGLVQPNDLEGCYLFSSPDVPAYLFRLCGLNNPKVGQVKQGESIGSANYLEFATMRRQPDGKWAMVEPASDILERTLNP